VDDGIAAPHDAAEPRRIEQVGPGVENLVPVSSERADDVTADEAARSRDVHAHRAHDCYVRELPSGTVTLLFTDIEGSTRLLHQLGDAYGEALAAHRRVLREAFVAHGGVEVDTQGDAFFFAFPNAAEAAAAAAEARDALADGPIRVRMGLHTGLPSRTDEGYYGLDVHLGARVAAVGWGGQVLLTRPTRELVDGDILDLGEHRVKDFEQPLWIYQLGREPFPPLKTLSNTNLPRPASSFVGREREVAEVVALLREARLVTLSGPGGSGKTRLAIEAASERVGEFPNGVFWVGLATVHDADLVEPAIAQVVGAQAELSAHIGEEELLLLLDNLEQVIEAAPALAALVEACPNLTLLVTSRELLRVRGEVEYQVLPLGEHDGVALFCERAQVEPSPAAEELCRRLDDMPLALELAAARAKALTPEQIVERLGERLDLFKGGRDAEPRQATLRATIEWSHALLSPEEQTLFRRLGVFVGGCTLDAASAVCDADLDTLQSLVEKSLVRHTEGRFWMLETIREYAVDRLEHSAEVDQLRRRHAEHLLALGESANLSAESDGPEHPEIVRAEIDNFRPAIDWALDHDAELAFRLTIALEQFWVMNDALEGMRRLAAVLERGADVPPVLRARALRTYAESIWISGDFESGIPLMEQALAEFERIGDSRAVAVILHRISVSALVAQDLPRARRLLDESLEMCRTWPNPKLEADAIGKLAWVEHGEGNVERALELLEESARLCEQIGFTWMQASAVMDIAEMSAELGRAEVAEERAREGLRLAHSLFDRAFTVFGLALLALFAAGSDHERAGRLWGAIEAEVARKPIGLWAHEEQRFADAILPLAGPTFEDARASGRTLPLDEAVAYALEED
jgi:predicted ATPase/class 3 adenylate cyclase